MTAYLAQVITALGWWILLSIAIGLPIGYAIRFLDGGAHGDD